MVRAEHGVRPVNESLEAGLWIGRLGGTLRVGSMPLPLVAVAAGGSRLVNPGGDFLFEVSELGVRLFLRQLAVLDVLVKLVAYRIGQGGDESIPGLALGLGDLGCRLAIAQPLDERLLINAYVGCRRFEEHPSTPPTFASPFLEAAMPAEAFRAIVPRFLECLNDGLPQVVGLDTEFFSDARDQTLKATGQLGWCGSAFLRQGGAGGDYCGGSQAGE